MLAARVDLDRARAALLAAGPLILLSVIFFFSVNRFLVQPRRVRVLYVHLMLRGREGALVCRAILRTILLLANAFARLGDVVDEVCLAAHLALVYSFQCDWLALVANLLVVTVVCT